MYITNIAVPLAIHSFYSYLSDEILNKGDLVNVNFHNKKFIALVLEDSIIYEKNEAENIKYKKVDSKIKEFKLNSKIVDFIKWVSDYNIIPIGLVFKFIFSEQYLEDNSKFVNVYKYKDEGTKKITKLQENVIEFLKTNKEEYFTFKELKKFSSLNVLKTLLKNECIIEDKKNILKYDYNINLDKIELNKLTEEQENIFNNIINFNTKPILLEGITGSGKTEIYFHLFEYYLKKDFTNQMLFLLPEIALTSQFINRFKNQFNCEDIAVWHSGVSNSEKKNIWKGVLDGKIKIVLGARSSLFLPFNNLQLLVVDEEHDISYKQTDNGCYNARDMAVVKAKIENIKVVLGSATPSLESLVNTENGKYNYCFLNSRFGEAVKPIVEIVDLKKNKLPNDKYLSKYLINEIKAELEKKNQVLLFMNRRGYAPMSICRECGYKFLCKNCSCTLTVHKKKERLICHQCGYSKPITTKCSECGNENSIIFFGPGVEKIEQEVKEHFNDKKIVIITSDTINNIKEITTIVQQIENREVDIIIGTQMITKGYDFPFLNLVGVLDADASLFGANFRSTERTYQLLTQVVGRVGRRERLGKAIIQSYTPENLIIQSLKNGDKNVIFDFEKQNREIAQLPPFGKLIMLIFYGKNEINVYRKIKEFVSMFNFSEKYEILGPTPTNLYRLNNDFRFKVLFKSENNLNLQEIVLNNIKLLKNDSKVSIKIDVNPYFIV